MVYLLLAAGLIIAVILYFRKLHSKLDKYEIKYLKPFPLLGNMTGILLKKRHITDIIQELYEKYPGERFTAMYEFTRVTIVINDTQLIKKIAIKDFDHFVNRKVMFIADSDPYLARNLFAMQGQDWKDMRSTLSPAFTSSKMRGMLPFMVEVNEQMIRALKEKIQSSNDGYIDIDCKDLTAKYANDVIATCAFGVKLDSHTKENDFYEMGKSLTDVDLRLMLVMFAQMAIPTIMKKLNIKLLPKRTSNFFRDLVMNNMKEREQHNILRPDMIHLLMEAKKGRLRHEGKDTTDAGFATVEESEIGSKTVNREWSNDDLIAQAVLFFSAGFETVSTTTTFLLYELALNPDVQDRLLQEIKEHDAKNEGKFDYKAIQELKYLDMVVSEALRLWPPVPGLVRECAKDYNIGRANDKASRDYIVRKGDQVTIPVWGIHRSAENFPDPLKFDPERFSDENKDKIKPFSYMPFGVGPRNCLGSRFALCELKVMVYQMIQHFELSPCDKTTIPAKLDPSTFSMLLQGGTWVRIKARN